MKIKILLAAAGIAASLAGFYIYHNIAAANNSNKEEIAYRQEMANLICDIKEYGQEHGKGDFFIIANGGAGLMESNEMFPEEDCDKLKAHLDGVMVDLAVLVAIMAVAMLRQQLHRLIFREDLIIPQLSAS